MILQLLNKLSGKKWASKMFSKKTSFVRRIYNLIDSGWDIDGIFSVYTVWADISTGSVISLWDPDYFLVMVCEQMRQRLHIESHTAAFMYWIAPWTNCRVIAPLRILHAWRIVAQQFICCISTTPGWSHVRGFFILINVSNLIEYLRYLYPVYSKQHFTLNCSSRPKCINVYRVRLGR